jgi:cytochrome oxidase assembly protein ShyY1
VVAAIGFAAAGSWQLRRLDDRRDRNRQIVAAAAAPAAPLEMPIAEYRKVRAAGTWVGDAEVSLPLQTRAGEAGVHLLTPLATDVGIFLVDRGWVPLDAVGDFPRATGSVDVTATVRLTRSGSATGSTEGGRPSVSRADPEAVSAMTGLALQSIVLELISATPATDPAPLPPLPAAVGEGNHLLYAIQWFSFIGIAVIGYAALLRRNAALPPRQPGDDPDAR